MPAVRDVIPMCLALDGQALWLAWLPSAQRAGFVGDTDGVLAAGSQARLMGAVHQHLRAARELPSCHLDIDSIVEDAGNGVLRDADGTLDAWHLFTDFAATARGSARPLFMEEHMATYHKVFSHCDAAANAGMPAQRLDSADLTTLATVLQQGCAMLRAETQTLWNDQRATAFS